MGKLFSVIFMNLWGFDILIFLAAVINGFIYYMVRKSAGELYKKMNHKIHVSHFDLSRKQTDKKVSALSIEDVIEMRDNEDRLYSLFINITAIFPLLGILGTVVSLLGLVSDMENVTGNFYGALTSTFWGLIFAIVFKFLDGMIAPKIENNIKSVQMYLDRVDGTEQSDDTAISGEGANGSTEKAENIHTDTASPESDPLFSNEPDKDLDFGRGIPEHSSQDDGSVIKVRNEDVQVLTEENGEWK